MRVNIEHDEIQKGLIFKSKWHQVTVHIEFSQEELAIIKKHDLNVKVMDRVASDPDDADPLEDMLDLRRLVNGPTKYAYKTPGEAKRYESELKELLPQLKEYIYQNAEVERQSSSFEI